MNKLGLDVFGFTEKYENGNHDTRNVLTVMIHMNFGHGTSVAASRNFAKEGHQPVEMVMIARGRFLGHVKKRILIH